MFISKANFINALEDIAIEALTQPDDYASEWCHDEIWQLIDDWGVIDYINDKKIADRITDLAPYLLDNIRENHLEETA